MSKELSIKEIVEKIKSIESWEWYFDPEIKDYGGFYEVFKTKYPNIEIDSLVIKRIGQQLIKKGPVKLTQDVIDIVQGTNIAFKATYNDAKFRGICSKELYEYNKEHHVWCGDETNECGEYIKKGIKNKFPCTESVIFVDFRVDAGMYQSGDRRGQWIPMSNVKAGKVVILTTRKPDTEENERYIFGIFDIEKFDDGKSKGIQTGLANVYGNKKTSIEIDERVKLKFWDFYKNIRSPDRIEWGCGLFRYLNDELVYKILQALKKEYQKLKLKTDKIDNLIERYKKWKN